MSRLGAEQQRILKSTGSVDFALKPLVALMKQARAFGVGVVVATQNPMDLDYRALEQRGPLVRRSPADGRRSRARGRGARECRGAGRVFDPAARRC